MDSLSFRRESLDLLWSEGAIYNLGFAEGIDTFRPFLRPGGVIAVSEITWLRPDPPAGIREHWESEYSQIAPAAEKISTLERAGYDLLGYFVLPPGCWLENYYAPTEKRISAFLQRHAGVPEARILVKMERDEADLFKRFQQWFGYGFYIARKR